MLLLQEEQNLNSGFTQKALDDSKSRDSVCQEWESFQKLGYAEAEINDIH